MYMGYSKYNENCPKRGMDFIMKKLLNPHIKLKETINDKDHAELESLQRLCLNTDKTTLKLEIDYKLSRAENKRGALENINEFMYYDEDELVGYIGICQFGGNALEVNGMVHPEYRRLGIFKKLYSLVKEEFSKRNAKSMLLLSDNNSISGQGFIKTTGAIHEHSEYEMFLSGEPEKKLQTYNLVLRKANNSDAREAAYQDAIYFRDEHNKDDIKIPEDEYLKMPEEEEKRGTTIYIAEVEGNIVGKVNIEVSNDIESGQRVGSVHALGVLPAHRSKGYGREILMGAIQKLKAADCQEIILQVVAKNKNALNLYKSCGFVETSTMDYYEITK